ncbi:hypothetical protein SAMN04487995_1635 [Dyadobacter koreensis]|uniref:Uncharacterized protein n=1 Tax=Dyadobacter koreensis TaxID=408657 RepID=A0A1H6RYZ0_9BACT|nr:hypothetical protein [Dyadobacter koreensis]SEI60901.1 hypothetical protein SAMN04487995_1635 [Dyadobacter koreensis]
MQTKFPLTLFVILLCISFNGIAATDSLIIKGRVLNLTGRLYRQAPVITFSRNNILQPQSEITKLADLQVDGSFRVSLPILFPEEEIYLDYSGKAGTTFLGSKGEIEITFDGDSLLTAKKLFYFAGVNATANNQYPQYLDALARELAANSVLGARFYQNFWEKSPSEAEKASSNRAEIRNAAISKMTSTVPDPTLSQWAQSINQDERLQNLYEYYLTNQMEIPSGNSVLTEISRLNQSPLTAQRVSLANRFANYADILKDEKTASGAKTTSLQVKLMATMIRDNVGPLTDDEAEKLNTIIERGIAEKIELDFLNNLYKRASSKLDLFFAYEADGRANYSYFDSTAADFLNARYLPKNLYKFSYKNQVILNKYIQTRIKSPHFRQSLDEIVRLEVKDSADISKMQAFRNLKIQPTEVLPEYWLSESEGRGNDWLNTITDLYKGKTLYLLKWNIDDSKSREDLEYAASLRAQLPKNVEFIYLHLPTEETAVSNDLVKQYIVRHQLKGVHMFLNSNQLMELLIKLNPLDAATYAIMKPNGKFATKKAPAPNKTAEIIKAIQQAGN